MTGCVQLDKDRNKQKVHTPPSFDLSGPSLGRTDSTDLSFMNIIMMSNESIGTNLMHYTSNREFSKNCKGFTSNISSLSCHLTLAKRSEEGSSKRMEVQNRSSKSCEKKIKRIKRMQEIYSCGLNRGQGITKKNDDMNGKTDDDSTEEILKWLETIN